MLWVACAFGSSQIPLNFHGLRNRLRASIFLSNQNLQLFLNNHKQSPKASGIALLPTRYPFGQEQMQRNMMCPTTGQAFQNLMTSWYAYFCCQEIYTNHSENPNISWNNDISYQNWYSYSTLHKVNGQIGAREQYSGSPHELSKHLVAQSWSFFLCW